MNSLQTTLERDSEFLEFRSRAVCLAQSLEKFNREKSRHSQEPIRIGNFWFQAVPCYYGKSLCLHLQYQNKWEIEIHDAPNFSLRLVDLAYRSQEFIYRSEEWLQYSPGECYQLKWEFYELHGDRIFPNRYLDGVPYESQTGKIGETGFTAVEIHTQIERALTLLEREICQQKKTPLRDLRYFLKNKWKSFQERLQI